MNFRAISYDSAKNAWLAFSQCRQVLLARSSDEVTALLDDVEAACKVGSFAIGYVSYEAALQSETVRAIEVNEALPVAAFGIFDDFEVIDLDPASTASLQLEPVISRKEYGEAFAAIREYLASGDTYQVNYTHPLKGQFSGQTRSLFARLAQAQRSPYATLIELDETSICCVSPELFFSRAGNKVAMEPMKGTRQRGLTADEDLTVKGELEDSIKDRAENLMIVDMVRNDLGRIARTGTVKTDRLFHLRKLPTVWQMVSNVTAESTASLSELFAALFPCASVTGAPKNRTMEIIAELEREPRGVYTGAVGLVKPGGDCTFSVAIRTLVLNSHTDKAVYGVGGGLVWDSDEVAEWQESLIKGNVLRHEQPAFELLETMKYEPGTGVVLEAEHLTRLAASAAYFDYPLDEGVLRAELSRFSAEEPRRLRLLLSEKGDLRLEDYELKGMSAPVVLKLAASAVDSRDVFLYHKTTHRRVYEQAASVSDCDDVILWNERGELTETTICNLFLQLDGELVTPALQSGLLAGTLRASLLAKGSVREQVLFKTDLSRAEKVFVGNSVRGLIEATVIPS